MKHYLLIFQTELEYQTYINGENVLYPNVCYVINTQTVYYNNGNEEDATSLKDFLEGDTIDVIIPDGTTDIRDYAFYHWTNLSSVTVPDSVVSVGMGAFQYCNSLPYQDGVRYAGTIAAEVTDGRLFPSVVVKQGTRLFQNNFSDNNYATQVTSYTLPTTLIAISNYCFQDCQNLVRINSNVDGDFILPEGIRNIGKGAFNRCHGAVNITLPSTVTTIGGSAFYQCNNLDYITILATTPPTLSGTHNFGSQTIYVPSASVNAYKTAWPDYSSNIQAIPTV